MAEEYTLNSTRAYHVNQLNSLGWELTVCNALYPEKTPIRKMLARDDSFGHLLYDYVSQFVPLEGIRNVIEIGGGYGFLMKDLLDKNGSLRASMIDISPFLLGRQKEMLKEFDVSFKEEDFLETDPAILARFELAIMNENLGDFPTLINLGRDIFEPLNESSDPDLRRAIRVFEKYGLERPSGEAFNLNIGALEAVEKLCASGVRSIYLGEHSCEAVLPKHVQPFIHIESRGNPERISLMGHDEYTIKFSYLQQIAHTFNYASIRGPFADFILVPMTDNLRLILASGGRYCDEAEMICHFVEDLYKYEYLILMKR